MGEVSETNNKKAMTDAAQFGDEDERTTEKSVSSLFFLGVPFGGLDDLGLVTITKERRNNRLVEDLMTYSTALPDLLNAFRKYVQRDNLKIISFHETEDTQSLVVGTAALS